MAPTPGLTMRKLADRSTGERVVRYDPETGAKRLVNPDTPGDDHEPWPLLGVQILDDPIPRVVAISTNKVSEGVHEGWLELEGDQLVHRPGGPPENRWRVTHTWTHAEAMTFKTVDGDVRFRVVRQPDKYAGTLGVGAYGQTQYIADDEKKVTDEVYDSGETVVDMFYVLELDN